MDFSKYLSLFFCIVNDVFFCAAISSFLIFLVLDCLGLERQNILRLTSYHTNHPLDSSKTKDVLPFPGLPGPCVP
jgi:hypothetical protein